jgi:hypothetical protein
VVDDGLDEGLACQARGGAHVRVLRRHGVALNT